MSRGTINEDQIAAASKLGAGGQLVTFSGVGIPVSGHVPSFAADGSLVDSGTTPGSGSGTTTGGLQVNGVTVSGDFELVVNQSTKPITVNGS